MSVCMYICMYACKLMHVCARALAFLSLMFCPYHASPLNRNYGIQFQLAMSPAFRNLEMSYFLNISYANPTALYFIVNTDNQLKDFIALLTTTSYY